SPMITITTIISAREKPAVALGRGLWNVFIGFRFAGFGLAR
ncbi:MAG: hypothetical protein ACI9C2_002684, partial [Gammaproteobacteria bacterium]